MDRIQLLSGLEPETLDNRYLREMYADREVEELIEIAKSYGYTHVIFTEIQRGIEKLSNELDMAIKDVYFENNNFYIYMVNNDNLG